MRISMFGRSLAIVAGAILLTVAALLAGGLVITERLFIDSSALELQRSAEGFSVLVSSLGPAAGLDPATAQAIAKSVAQRSGFRVTIVAPDGKVTAESDAEAATMASHSDRPEIRAALSGKTVWTRRQSATTGVWTLYAAAPLVPEGALRLALPLPDMMDRLRDSRNSVFLIALAAAVSAIIASALLSRQVALPAARLAARSKAYASGDLSPHDRFKSMPEELRILSDSLDAMASELGRRIDEAEALGSRFAAILESTGEAILALDGSLEVIAANPAAGQLFSKGDGKGLEGRKLLDLSRSEALNAAAAACLASGTPAGTELTLYGETERTFNVHVSPLLRQPAGPVANDASVDSGPASPAGLAGTPVPAGSADPAAPAPGRMATPVSGVVLALGEVTELRRLERIRTDFVANVSHELRTPIQMIKGFAETIRVEGGVSGSSQRYLGIIEQNAGRMERIVSDLLSLAMLERDPGSWLYLEDCVPADILKSAIDSMSAKAEARHVSIESDIPDGVTFKANPGLIEQAIANLLDNAVQYSPPEAMVRISARVGDGAVEFAVADRGPGIPAADLDRIFERFYRVDKSRSRQSGGTGLGLAIVRHIAIAHGGSVRAESWSGEGSTFRLSIPLEPLGQMRGADLKGGAES